MTTSQVFRSIRHDTGSSPKLTLTPPEGATWNLQEVGVTVKLTARLAGDPTPKIDAAAQVTGPWEVTYNPVAADVNTIGTYDVQVTVTRSNGKPLTFPTADPGEPGSLTWRIGTDLDNT